MKNDTFIDGKDIFINFGATITGGIESLLSFPTLKNPEYNDWPEEDGIEVNLENPVLQSKESTLSFIADKYREFIQYLSKPGYRTLLIPHLGRQWELRLKSQENNKILNSYSAFSLKFIEDNPMRKKDYPSPSGSGTWVNDTGYYLDNINFKDYGVEVFLGNDDVLKSPTVKENMTRQISTIDGQIYNTDEVVFSNKDVTFKCLFAASNWGNYWKCYDAFFNDWIKPNERILHINSIGGYYPVYYKKSDSFSIKSLCDPIVVEFNLTLAFTSMRIKGIEYILATEDNRVIVLEDGITRIDMKLSV